MGKKNKHLEDPMLMMDIARYQGRKLFREPSFMEKFKREVQNSLPAPFYYERYNWFGKLLAQCYAHFEATLYISMCKVGDSFASVFKFVLYKR